MHSIRCFLDGSSSSYPKVLLADGQSMFVCAAHTDKQCAQQVQQSIASICCRRVVCRNYACVNTGNYTMRLAASTM